MITTAQASFISTLVARLTEVTGADASGFLADIDSLSVKGASARISTLKAMIASAR